MRDQRTESPTQAWPRKIWHHSTEFCHRRRRRDLFQSYCNLVAPTNAYADHNQGKKSASDVSFYRFTLEQAGLSALQPLALPTPPTIRSLSRPYSDQYGWIPFDEYQFVYAARVALDIWEDDFRAILATEGGFRRFWDSCDLPRWSAPSKDTKALSLWEIDDLLNSINEYPLLPEPVPSLMYGDFKSRITRSSVERAQGQRVLPQYRPDEVTEESVCTEAESSLLSTSEFRDDPEHDADDSSGSSSLLSVDAPSVPAITTEERMANVAKVLHNFRPREVKRLETDETDIIERGLETMSMYSKSAEPAFEVGGPTEEVFLKAAKGESEPAQNGLAVGSDPACCSCSICARTIEELQSSKLTRHEKRDERDSTESELSRCCGDSSEDSDGDEKHCQGIV